MKNIDIKRGKAFFASPLFKEVQRGYMLNWLPTRGLSASAQTRSLPIFNNQENDQRYFNWLVNVRENVCAATSN